MDEKDPRASGSSLPALVGAAILGGTVALFGVVVLIKSDFLSQEKSESDKEIELTSSEPASPKDLVRLCDESAADPDDPRKTVSSGVYLDEFTHNRRSPHEALSACEEALSKASADDQPRIYYQLARINLYLDRLEQADRYLGASQASGYPAANFAVAQMFYEREKQTDSVNYEGIIATLRLAAEGGHSKAASMMARVLDEEFPMKAYQLPGLMRAIYDGRLDDVPDDIFTRSVNLAIYQHLKDYCKQFEASIVNIITETEVNNYSLPLQVNSAINGIAGFFEFLGKASASFEKFNKDSDLGGLIRDINTANADWDNSMAYLHTLGYRDAGSLVASHGCHGQQSSRFINNLNALFQARQGAQPRHAEQAQVEALYRRPVFDIPKPEVLLSPASAPERSNGV